MKWTLKTEQFGVNQSPVLVFRPLIIPLIYLFIYLLDQYLHTDLTAPRNMYDIIIIFYIYTFKLNR